MEAPCTALFATHMEDVGELAGRAREGRLWQKIFGSLSIEELWEGMQVR